MDSAYQAIDSLLLQDKHKVEVVVGRAGGVISALKTK